jgi:multidrug efflux pump subunit AcrA (membrane-fusion protein)
MNTPPIRSENPEAGASPGTKRRNGTSGNQDSVRARRPGTILKALVTAVVIVAVSVAIYFLAIYPKVQNDKKLAAAAAAAGKTTVTVVEPTQTSSAPELILPGNVEGNQMTSIYSRVDGYIKKWYVDIGDHVQQGQILADVEAPALLIPDNSILIDSKGARVLVVDSSNKIRIKPVTLGRDFGTKSEILGGLDATDQVVQNPTEALHEGMIVSVERAMQGPSK